MRLIDADKATELLSNMLDTVAPKKLIWLSWESVLRRLTTIDAVQVVRCKDCKYCNGEYEYCYFDIFVKPDGYCSYGETTDEVEE